MVSFIDKIKRKLKIGQTDIIQTQQQPIQTQQRNPADYLLTPEQRLQSVEQTPKQELLTPIEAATTPFEEQTPWQRLQSVEGQPTTFKERITSTDIRDRPSLQEIRDAADAAGFAITRDADFEATANLRPDLQKGFITYTRRDTGETYKLTWAEYRALSKGAIGNSNDPNYIMNFSENLENLQNAQFRADVLREYLESTLRGTALSEELGAKYADVLDKLQNLDTDTMMSLADAEAMFEGELPEGFFSAQGLFKIAGAAGTAGTAAFFGSPAGFAVAAPVVIGLLVNGLSDLTSTKQRRLDVVNQQRQDVKEFLPFIESGVKNGDYSIEEGYEMIRHQIDLLKAGEAIAKHEADTFSGDKLSDAKKTQKEIRDTLDYLIPAYQRRLAAAAVSPTTSGQLAPQFAPA